MGCKGASSFYLKLLNTLVLLCSLVIIGYSAFLVSELADFKDAVTQFPIYGPLAFGVVLLLISIVGLVGATKQNKCFLFLYILITTVITVIVLGCGAALLAYGGFLDNVEEGKVSNGIEERIQDFELAVFNDCCAEVFGLTPPESCDTSSSSVCITDQENFDSFREVIGEQVCEALTNVEIDGTPIVGNPADNGGCGNGSDELFVQSMSQFLVDNIKALGITNLVLAVIMLLDIIASCVLLWSSKEEYGYGKKANKEGDKQGPEIATGSHDVYAKELK